MLEKRCLKFIWSCINSNNTIVKSVSSSAIMYCYSSLGENYRFLSDKYDIWPINWTKSFSFVLRKFYDYLDKHVYSANEAILIRDLCIKLDSGDFSFFNIDELNERLFYCVQHESCLTVLYSGETLSFMHKPIHYYVTFVSVQMM